MVIDIREEQLGPVNSLPTFGSGIYQILGNHSHGHLSTNSYLEPYGEMD